MKLPSADPSAENLSQQAHRRLIGYLGLLLPFLLYIVAGLRRTAGLVAWRPLGSISAYYYTGAIAVFVGVLFALALFLLTYRGYKGVIADRVLGLIGGTAAILVALFPTSAPAPIVPPSWWRPGMATIHYVSAVALFLSFILFAIWLFRKSNVPRRADRPLEKRRRDDICLACGIVMIVSVLWAASAMFTHAAIVVPESIAIIAFAISWLTKGEAHKPVMTMLRSMRQQMSAPTVAILIVAVASPLATPSVEQTTQGRRPPATLVASFDGLGVGLQGPHGRYEARNPSDNSVAVGPDYVVQIVNTRMAIFRKNGEVVYGPVPTNTLFKGFGGACETHNNGDAVVRYDQLANRWLIVMPVFTRSPERPDQPGLWQAQASGVGAYTSPPGVAGQPGPAAPLFVPPTVPPGPPEPPDTARRFRQRPPEEKGPYSMCYAVSTSPDPLAAYYRYEFLRPLFPDYPRPAVWPDGYYVPTSTGDEVIQKHACVADRAHMLRGEPATEQCVIIDGVNFLNTSDLDGTALPPAGTPNVILAAGGTQLHGVFDDSAIYAWQLSVNWSDSSRTRLTGPQKIAVAPYHYLCDGQLTTCVRQPGTDQHLDAQGDKLMARVVYRNVNGRESIVAVHSVATRAGGGGVRWYEFTVSPSDRALRLRQQGTYAPDSFYRWMASPAIDREGNIGIGYSFGGSPNFAGQRFAGRLANDPLGTLTVHETVLVEGAAPQANTMRWEDYTQTAIDPTDDCTIWYVGDYLKKDAWAYSTRIAAFRLCP